MSRYAELGCSGWNAGKIGGPRYTPTRARGDPIVMLEMLTAKTLEEKLDGTKISPYKARKLSKQAKLAPCGRQRSSKTAPIVRAPGAAKRIGAARVARATPLGS